MKHITRSRLEDTAKESSVYGQKHMHMNYGIQLEGLSYDSLIQIYGKNHFVCHSFQFF